MDKVSVNVSISQEQKALLDKPVNGCYHSRSLLVLIDKTVLYCSGCGTDFGNVFNKDEERL